jgi:hypothetical protein
MLFMNFEIGARGVLREKIGSAWKQYTVTGEPEVEAKTYSVYLYHIGMGTGSQPPFFAAGVPGPSGWTIWNSCR